jgi:hypothetical protein
MRIGLDFDNTLVSYDKLFIDAASAKGWIPALTTTTDAGGKIWVSNIVRQLADGEIKWQTLQAEVYGPRMNEAVLLDGVATFLQEAVRRKVEMFIVSHKTRFARRDTEKKSDLRLTALDWMDKTGFFTTDGFRFSRENIFFCATRKEKVDRIAKLNCDYFIDDLPEVFAEPGFPARTKQILIAPHGESNGSKTYKSFQAWTTIHRELLGANNNR